MESTFNCAEVFTVKEKRHDDVMNEKQSREIFVTLLESFRAPHYDAKWTVNENCKDFTHE